MMQGKAIGTLFASTAKVDVDQGDLVELPLSKEALTVEVRLVASQGTLARRAAQALIELADPSRGANFDLD
jgi:hypothetical protein